MHRFAAIYIRYRRDDRRTQHCSISATVTLHLYLVQLAAAECLLIAKCDWSNIINLFTSGVYSWVQNHDTTPCYVNLS